jgi:hypothetical protein
MDLMFNELSVFPLADNKYLANKKILLFAKTVSKARERGFQRIRTNCDFHDIILTNNYSLYDWIFDNEFFKANHIYRDFLLGMFVKPFIDETDTEVEEQYINEHYYFEDVGNNIKRCECFGLVSAYLYRTLSISFQSGSAWIKNNLEIAIVSDDHTVFKKIKNVFSEICFKNPDIDNFIKQFETIKLVETIKLPDEKKLHLSSDHHGYEKLKNHWERLKKCPYVIEGRSTNFSRGSPQYIIKVEPEGFPGAIILAPDPPYTLWIQSTGRNYWETKEISRILQREYS